MKIFSRTILIILAMVSIAVGQSVVAPAFASEAPTSHAQPMVGTFDQVPLQPLRTDTDAGANEGSVEPMNEPVWTRTCDRGYGTEIWNNQNGADCLGSLTFYYYNVADHTFNMVAFMANQPSGRSTSAQLALAAAQNLQALRDDVNAWCSSHSFECTTGVALAFLFLSLL